MHASIFSAEEKHSFVRVLRPYILFFDDAYRLDLRHLFLFDRTVIVDRSCIGSDLLHDIKAFIDLAESGILAIEPFRIPYHDEELRCGGIHIIGSCHR